MAFLCFVVALAFFIVAGVLVAASASLIGPPAAWVAFGLAAFAAGHLPGSPPPRP